MKRQWWATPPTTRHSACSQRWVMETNEAGARAWSLITWNLCSVAHASQHQTHCAQGQKQLSSFRQSVDSGLFGYWPRVIFKLTWLAEKSLLRHHSARCTAFSLQRSHWVVWMDGHSNQSSRSCFHHTTQSMTATAALVPKPYPSPSKTVTCACAL